jgi:Dyp-type peroxidase family
VLRQLRQDVAGFWRYVDRESRRADGSSDPQARLWLASKLVGRWPSGAPLATSPAHDDPRLAEWNDFGYGLTDRHGLSCPLGAHVRRANPRDSLDPEPGTDRSVEINRRHRILRRGRKYGAGLTIDSVFNPDQADDETERGLHFIGLCANLQRQFEFIQHTWINNPKFDGLYDDVDPLVGTRPTGGCFTIQAQPIRRRLRDLPQFVTVRGGGYFFLPGIRALRYLASLGS